MSGAQRQILVVFATFMMVERSGFEMHQITALFIVTPVTNMALGPVFGAVVQRFGERAALTVEYPGLTLVCLACGGIDWFGWSVVLAAALHVIDYIFLALARATKTCLQKIADPGDIAPTAALAFTITPIAAVILPALPGCLRLVSPGAVFGLAAGMALVSLGLALMIPRHPAPGHETILRPFVTTSAE